MIILGIDPGPVNTAWVAWDVGEQVVRASDYTESANVHEVIACHIGLVAIEEVACYGMAVGAEVFATARWCGKFERTAEVIGLRIVLIKRMECKMNLCHDSRAKDSNIRQALIDRFGQQGTKKNPGPLYGITGDKLAALAVAVTAGDKYAATSN